MTVARDPRDLERRTFWIVCAALVVVYAASLAPDLTLWDAGEFNAAIASLGVPHPPGTPLFVLLARAWSLLLRSLPQVVAVNALSAVATAVACALLARLMARWTRSTAAGVAGGIAAGAMFSVWQNATETEVYALSLLLAALLLWAGDRAARRGGLRDRVLFAYLGALSVPLQISALVAAPAGLLLAGTTPSGQVVPRRVMTLGGVVLLAAGAGLVSPLLAVAGVLVLGLTSVMGRSEEGRRPVVEPLVLVAVVLLGVSATLFMLVRARHDPGVNQGNPATWDALLGVIARRQYDVPGLWPRRAPAWLQVANLTQYADWQVAYGLDDAPGATLLRTPFSILFGVLAVVGARWHWRRDPRSARAIGLLLLSGTLGVVTVLNLRAGPSIGFGVLPPDALHEARERDYFFALGFAAAALWAGAGAVAVAGRLAARREWLGIVVACVPVATNWGAADRRRQPDASLASTLGDALLQSAPRRAVLLLAGDNDSYAIWYQQQALGTRRDVTPITMPLLPARWYRAELARRDTLIDATRVETWAGEGDGLAAIDSAARALGRPLATSAAVPRDVRTRLGGSWSLRGLVFVRNADVTQPAESLPGFSDGVIESATAEIAGRISQREPDANRWARDPTSRYIQALLSCPGAVMTRPTRSAELLASTCNFK